MYSQLLWLFGININLSMLILNPSNRVIKKLKFFFFNFENSYRNSNTP